MDNRGYGCALITAAALLLMVAPTASVCVVPLHDDSSDPQQACQECPVASIAALAAAQGTPVTKVQSTEHVAHPSCGATCRHQGPACKPPPHVAASYMFESAMPDLR